MKTVTPDDSHGHIFGSGALSFSWWLKATSSGVDEDYHAADNWSVKLSIEDPNEEGKRITKTVNHAALMKAAREVLADEGPEQEWGGTEKLGVSRAVVQGCKDLVFNADDCDFDAPMADELLQVIMLGKITYG